MTERQPFLNKLLYAAGAGIVLTIAAVFVLAGYFDKSFTAVSKGPVIYTDTVSSAFFTVRYKNRIRRLFFPDGPAYKVVKKGGPEVKILKGAFGFYVTNAQETGQVDLTVEGGSQSVDCSVRVLYTVADMDRDGFPDVVEISSRQDRDSFISWFVTIAQSQFYIPSHTWYNVHRDCAGLIVFAYKEALKKHDVQWHKGFSYLTETEISDVQQYNYPYVPLLGDTIFRTAAGPFDTQDLEKDVFAPTCNVSNLLNFNMQLISRDARDMQAGDVIFYRVDSNPSMPFHSMIYTGEYLVYHTGPMPGEDGSDTEGEVRMIETEVLFSHPDKVWHPARDNPAFLGVYRFNIITG